MPQLSIVVPVYKVEKYLEQCVLSILGQTFSDFELILVDDGSPDFCPEMCDAWAEKDARVRVIHKKNGGLRSAVLAGLGKAEGEYIGFVDSDDYVDAQMFACLMQAVQRTGADLAECGFLRVENGPEERFGSQKEQILDRLALEEKVLRPFFERDGEFACFTAWARWNKLYRTRLLQKAVQGCDVSISIGEDCTLTMAYLTLCQKAVILAGEYHYFYRRSASSMVLDSRNLLVDRPYIQELHAIARRAGYQETGIDRLLETLKCRDVVEVLYAPVPPAEKKKLLKRAVGRVKPQKYRDFCAQQPPLTRLALQLSGCGIPPVAICALAGITYLQNRRKR